MFSLEKLKQQLIDELNKHLPAGTTLDADIFEYPPDSKLGDIAFPCFKLAGKLKQPPPILAQNLKEKLAGTISEKVPVKEIKVAGSYLNFVLDKNKLFQEMITKKIKKLKTKNYQPTTIIEYVSPNSNKPLHLGHVRNALIGEALSAILKKSNGKILKTCLVNDRGIHIIKSMLAYQKFGKKAPARRSLGGGWETPQKVKEKGDFFVGKYYILYGQKLAADQNLEKEAYKMLKKWENGDKKTIALWKKMNGWWLSGFKETCQKLGVKFNKIYFENKIYKLGKKLVLDALKNKIFEKDEKENIVANLEKYGMPNKVVLRADGTSVYATNDLFLAYQRAKDFPFDKLIYVVASEQDLYFKQLLKIFEIIKAPFAKKLEHLSYGLVLLPEGKLKSREGTRVDADDLIKNIEEMTILEAKKRHHYATKRQISDLKKRSEILAMAALKYYILQIDPKSEMLFKPEESISLAGRTGIYLEYAFARIQSIFVEATKRHPPPHPSPLGRGRVREGVAGVGWRSDGVQIASTNNLVMQILKYEETLGNAARDLNPAHLANYLFELAQKFNDFYEKAPILNSPEPARTERLALIKMVANILKEGMDLLGIKTVKEV